MCKINLQIYYNQTFAIDGFTDNQINLYFSPSFIS